MKKRIVSLLLALVMCLSLLPPAAFAASGRVITLDDFPDSFFHRDLVKLPGGEDGKFTPAEIANIKKINVTWSQTEDLTGIEYFTALEELDLHDTNVYALDLRKNTRISKVNVSNCQLLCAALPPNAHLTEWENSGGQRTRQVDRLETMADLPASFDASRVSHAVGGSFSDSGLERRGAVLAYDYQVTKDITLRCSVQPNSPVCTVAMVKFQLDRNGTWADGSREPLYVELPWNQGGQRATLPADRIPTGMKPAFGYEGAGWTPAPNTRPNGITQPLTTYTYQFTALPRIYVTENTFPDPQFLEVVKSLPGAEDGVLFPREIEKIRTLDCSDRPIRILEGIQYLTALESVNIQNTKVFSLDLVKQPGIKSVAVGGSPLYAIRLHPAANVTHWDIGTLEPYSVDNHYPLTNLTDAFDLAQVGDVWGGCFDNGTINFTGRCLRYEYHVADQTLLCSFQCWEELEPTTATVTFALGPGGVWADGTTGPIYQDVALHDGRGTLSQAQIPAVSDSKTSVAAGWEEKPNTQTGGITGDVTYTYLFQEKQDRATVTFRVVNGTWADGTTGSKTVSMQLTEGRGTLRASQIPTGMQPKPGYELGAWNVRPDTSQGAVIRDVTYTYTFAREEAPSITIGETVLTDLSTDHREWTWEWVANEHRLYFNKDYFEGPIKAVKVKDLNLSRHVSLSEGECWTESSFGRGVTKGVLDRFVDTELVTRNCRTPAAGSARMRVDSSGYGTCTVPLQPEADKNIVVSVNQGGGREELLQTFSAPVNQVQLRLKGTDRMRIWLRGQRTTGAVLANACQITNSNNVFAGSLGEEDLTQRPNGDSPVLGCAAKLPPMQKNDAFRVQCTMDSAADRRKTELLLLRQENGKFVEVQSFPEMPEEALITVDKGGDYYLFLACGDSYHDLVRKEISFHVAVEWIDRSFHVDLNTDPVPAPGSRWGWNKKTHTLTLQSGFQCVAGDRTAFRYQGDLTVVVEGEASILSGAAGIHVSAGQLTVRMQPGARLTLRDQENEGLSAERIVIDGGRLEIQSGGAPLYAAGSIRFLNDPLLDLRAGTEGGDGAIQTGQQEFSIPGTFQLLGERRQVIYEGTWSQGVQQGKILMKNKNVNTGRPPLWQIYVQGAGSAQTAVTGIRSIQQGTVTYQVFFEAGGAQGAAPAALTAAVNADTYHFALPGPGQLSRPGYEFTGWLHRTSGRIFQSGEQVTLHRNDPVMTLTAQWRPLPVVRVDIPEADPRTVPADFYAVRNGEGELVLTIPSRPVPQREGFRFQNYLLTASGIPSTVCAPGEKLVVGRTVKAAQTYTLGAQWTALEAGIPAPSGFLVEVREDGRPYLTWNGVPGADKYEIQRAVDDGRFQTFYTAKGTSGALRNGSADPGSVYRYRIRTIIGSETSAWAESAGVMARCGQPKVSAALNSSGKPVLTWEKVTGAVKYDVLRSAEGGPFVHLTYAKGTKLTNGSANAGVTYRYQVVAVCGVPNADSVPSQVDTIQCGIAVPVTNLTTNASSGKPVLTWEKVDGAAAYQVYRKVGKNGTWQPLFRTEGTRMTNGSAKPGTTYYYYVVAIADGGMESGSSTSRYITCDCARPNVTARLRNGKPYLRWDQVSGAVKYEVYRSVNGGSYQLLTTVTGTHLTNSSARKGQTCKYRVKAICANKYGNSALSYTDTVQVK